MNIIKHIKKYVFLISLIGFLVVFTGCQAELNNPIQVTGITVTGANGATSVTDGGTLQVSAAILPADATDPSVTWSVVAGTEVTATIDAAGLLTATGVGNVTVKATANDGSAIEGSLVVSVVNPVVKITLAAIPGVTAPVTGETPIATAIDTAQYTGSVAWASGDNPYKGEVVYTATISLTPKAGFTLTGVSVNFFTVDGALATSDINSGEVEAVFTATEAAPITLNVVSGVTAPVRGATPVTTITPTDQYTGTVTWDPVVIDAKFGSNIAYKATITLTAETGYTLIGVTKDFFTVDGASPSLLTNAVNAGVVVATFPITAIAPLARVVLGTAGNYAILAESGVSTAPTSVITGDVGLSPIDSTALTGFSETLVGTYATSDQVTGNLYASNMANPTPSNLTTAISDMETAYTDAAGRTIPDYVELKAGLIGGETLTPGLYKWTNSVNISGSNLILKGSETDIWIFQIDGDLTIASALSVTLDGALAKNIFWQVAGSVTMGSTSHFEGVVLCKTNVAMLAGSSMNGRLLAQTAVTLNQATVTEPAL